MLSHIGWHGVPLLFDVEKHKMNRVTPQVILQVCQQVDECTLRTTGSERVDDKDYVSRG
jgi:hypothetical protein